MWRAAPLSSRAAAATAVLVMAPLCTFGLPALRADAAGSVDAVGPGVGAIDKLPGPATSLAAVACVSTTTCYAVGNSHDQYRAAVVTLHSGKPSRAGVFGPAGTTLDAIACGGGQTCEAIGSNQAGAPIGAAIDGGRPGPVKTLGPVGLEVSSVACAGAGTCLVVGDTGLSGYGAVIITLKSGHAVSSKIVPHEVLFDSVACRPTICYAVAAPTASREDLYELGVNGNVLEGPVPFGKFSPVSITCPGATTCYAVGDFVHHPPFRAGVVAVTNGKVGEPHAMPGVTGSNAVVCVTAKVCIALGYYQPDASSQSKNLQIIVHNGAPGTPSPLPSVANWGAVACATVTGCVLVGDEKQSPYDAYVATVALPQFSPGGGRRF